MIKDEKMKKTKEESEIFNTSKKIGDLKLVDYNPRKQDRKVIEKIKNSIKEFGFVQPLVVNKNNNIIGGNQRYVALLELYGTKKEVPVVMLDLDETKERALNIALNKISGTWDFIKLTEILTSLNALNLSDITGFDKVELNLMDIGVTTSEIEIKPNAKIIRYPLTFYFDNVNDKMAAESYFGSKKEEKELIITNIGIAKGKKSSCLIGRGFRQLKAYILIPEFQ